MANTDSPKGFWPLRHLTGGEIRTQSYPITASQTIYKGDPLKVVAGGTVEVAAANDGVVVIGIAAEYKVGNSAGTTLIQVYDDPYIVFGVQGTTGTTLASSARFATANMITYATGDTKTKVSIMELAVGTLGTTTDFKIIGLIDAVDNVWGEHTDLEVVFNNHFYKAAVAGV